MFKRFFLALAVTAGLLSPSYGAGTVPGFSLTVQYDNAGNLARGCQLNVIQAGTTSTPQIAYQDSALTIPSPGGSVLTCDGVTARLPQFFLADGLIKFRLSDKNGTQVFAQDNLLVIGPSSGSGGGGTVDPTTILATGDIKATYGTGSIAGFVRLNGRTIGSASSGASERANADTQALFQYLWGADPNLVVSTGRGVSANADWVANKQLTLPDFRSRALAGLGDMGNADNALFAGVTFTSGNSTTLGSLVGAAQRTLALSQIPAGITSSASLTLSVKSGPINILAGTPALSTAVNGSGLFGTSSLTANQITSSGVNAINVTSDNTGGQAFDAVSPYGLVTIYAKL